jgi:hypothetical protein
VRTPPDRAGQHRRRGRTCRAYVKKAAEAADLSGFHGWQVAKAAEAIEEQAVVPSSRPGLYASVSGDGVTVYLTDAIEGSCTCKAGAKRAVLLPPGGGPDLAGGGPGAEGGLTCSSTTQTAASSAGTPARAVRLHP